jgi:hypothetical protein
MLVAALAVLVAAFDTAFAVLVAASETAFALVVATFDTAFAVPAATFDTAVAIEDDKSIAGSDSIGGKITLSQSPICSYRKEGTNWRELMFP